MIYHPESDHLGHLVSTRENKPKDKNNRSEENIREKKTNDLLY